MRNIYNLLVWCVICLPKQLLRVLDAQKGVRGTPRRTPTSLDCRLAPCVLLAPFGPCLCWRRFRCSTLSAVTVALQHGFQCPENALVVLLSAYRLLFSQLQTHRQSSSLLENAFTVHGQLFSYHSPFLHFLILEDVRAHAPEREKRAPRCSFASCDLPLSATPHDQCQPKSLSSITGAPRPSPRQKKSKNHHF